ncbi:MAG: hypothetical protein IPJ81_01185 [Chitinophagaceae bacterium]|nr:hypothetical protein [Chitinophagaceae bacterium]
MQTDLATILQYRNEDVISRFCDQFDIAPDEAEDIFRETKKFLYLAKYPSVFIPDELLIIDEMWHNFILFTKVYHHFSTTYFNEYLHHLPASKSEKEASKKLAADNPTAAKEEYLKKFEALVSTVYDVLGEDTVLKWFEIYPRQYSKSKINLLRKTC